MLCGWVTKPGIPALTGGEQTRPPGSVSHQLLPLGFCQQTNLTVGRTRQVQGKGAVSSQPPLLPGIQPAPISCTRFPRSIWLLWSQTELQAEGEWAAGSGHREGRAWSSESISQCIWRQQPSAKAGHQGALQICSFCGTEVPLWMHECPEPGLLPAEVLPEAGASSVRGRGIWGEMWATTSYHFIRTLSVFPI